MFEPVSVQGWRFRIQEDQDLAFGLCCRKVISRAIPQFVSETTSVAHGKRAATNSAVLSAEALSTTITSKARVRAGTEASQALFDKLARIERHNDDGDLWVLVRSPARPYVGPYALQRVQHDGGEQAQRADNP